ncbi:MAG: hypothetical protein K6C94_00730 [Candidatus Gastranaerophilales bacterium]|nr:hypothetical protein [Candidatus Gastranaerophilales bacterium]
MMILRHCEKCESISWQSSRIESYYIGANVPFCTLRDSSHNAILTMAQLKEFFSEIHTAKIQ